MLTPETILQARYRIIRQLGQGGMGAVYEAVDTRLDTTVALKETLFTDERLRKQFEREARLLARLHHPALPRVSDHFTEGDGAFLVMQFIAGDDLAEMVTRRKSPFPPDQVLNWADQLLDALDYLHTQTPQIIHRDIKPQNLKLTSRGQIILLDFGLAKGQVAEVGRVSTTASIFGYTPNYAPLEQIQGLGTDPRSDIYALAATLYHLITGIKPADALTRAAAVVNSQADPLQRASEVNGNVAPSVSAVLEMALAQNRDQRYTSAAEMRRALQQSAASTVANRTEADTVLFPSSRPSGVAETKADVLQPTVPTGETTVLRTPSKPRRAAWAFPVAAVVLLLAIAGGFYAYRNRNNSAAVNQPPADAQPSATIQTQVQVAAPSPSTEVSEGTKEVASDKEKVAADEKAVRKHEQAAQKQRETVRKVEDQADRREQPDVPQPGDIQVDPDVPETPNAQPPRVPRGRPTETVVPDGTRIRHFPDGTQVIISPNGRRVMIRPDGTRFVLEPGQRVPRRVLRRP
jgi:eukaryotic-like serine/threonine-protein kinase